jgi:hypothetical protein
MTSQDRRPVAGPWRLLAAGCLGIAALVGAGAALLVMGIRSSSLHTRDSEIVANHFIDTLHVNDPDAGYLLTTVEFRRGTTKAQLAEDYAKIAREAGLLGAGSDRGSVQSGSVVEWRYVVKGSKRQLNADLRLRRERGDWLVDRFSYSLQK